MQGQRFTRNESGDSARIDSNNAAGRGQKLKAVWQSPSGLAIVLDVSVGSGSIHAKILAAKSQFVNQ